VVKTKKKNSVLKWPFSGATQSQSGKVPSTVFL
jgi:hypothetical protein